MDTRIRQCIISRGVSFYMTRFCEHHSKPITLRIGSDGLYIGVDACARWVGVGFRDRVTVCTHCEHYEGDDKHNSDVMPNVPRTIVIEVTPQRRQMHDTCLKICATCDYHTTAMRIEKHETQASNLTRIASNVVFAISHDTCRETKLSDIRCKICTCRASWKARLFNGRGCPEKKWPRDIQ